MKRGAVILNRVLRFSRWIALAAAVFLLSANLDNIPDCPELFNSNCKASASLQLVHHDVATTLNAFCVTWENFQPPTSSTYYISDVFLAIPPPGITPPLYRSADSSPPSA
jgi:hypothetical protein